jgi:hypothetical protein
MFEECFHISAEGVGVDEMLDSEGMGVEDRQMKLE